jgi:hypothetical protein
MEQLRTVQDQDSSKVVSVAMAAKAKADSAEAVVTTVDVTAVVPEADTLEVWVETPTELPSAVVVSAHPVSWLHQALPSSLPATPTLDRLLL